MKHEQTIVDVIIHKHYSYIRDTPVKPKYLILSPDMTRNLIQFIHDNDICSYNCDSPYNTFEGMDIVIKENAENFIEIAG